MAEPLVPLRSLVRLEHAGGAVKHVELLGFTSGGPLRAMINWAGTHYEIDLKEGRLIGMPPTLTALWRVPPDVLEQLRAAAERPSRAKKRGAA